MTEATLDRLRDIREPDPPPLAALSFLFDAGFVALALLLVVLLTVLWFRRRRRLSGRGERQPGGRGGSLPALRTAYAVDGDGPELARRLNGLLRAVALERYGSPGILNLAGEEWLAFLDRTGGGEGFRQGAGRCLETLPYQRAGQVDADGLLALVQAWLDAHA